jgi:glycosyltransferase involved in cell wall biosynthesis
MNKKCGIGRYTNELGSYLSTTEHTVHGYRKDERNEVFEVYPHRSFRNLRHYIAPYYLAKAIKNKKADIWHADYVDAASSFFWHTPKKPYILFTNVHDAIPFIYSVSGLAFEVYKRQLSFAASHSYKLIVVSETSKKDLVEYAGINPEKIEVIYNGINHSDFFPVHTENTNQKFTIRYVGGLGSAHKNVAALIEVGEILEQKGLDFVLEIGGGSPEKTILPLLADTKNLKSVKFTGYVPDSELREFYSGADLFLYPSKYEGFGFPPLEAMACGTATVSSNAGSLGEILGAGALTVDPNPNSLAMAAEMVMRQPMVKFNLQRNGLKQAAKYTWENSGDAHLSLFEDALSYKSLNRRAS